MQSVGAKTFPRFAIRDQSVLVPVTPRIGTSNNRDKQTYLPSAAFSMSAATACGLEIYTA